MSKESDEMERQEELKEKKRKKQAADAKKVPVGSGLVERARKAIISRKSRIDEAVDG